MPTFNRRKSNEEGYVPRFYLLEIIVRNRKSGKRLTNRKTKKRKWERNEIKN
jgi:hypothetical protein